MAPVPLILIVVDIKVCFTFDVKIQRMCFNIVFVLFVLIIIIIISSSIINIYIYI